MPYLQRINYRPSAGTLSPHEEMYLANHFDAYGAETVIEGQVIPWTMIEAVEVVVAPHALGLAGWLVKTFVQRGEDRYHVGVYFDSREAVLPNITWKQAKFVVESIAFYAPNPVKFTGPDNLVPLIEL